MHAIAFASLGQGCARPPAVTLESAHRLTDLLETPAGEPTACALEDEIRPALGCLRVVLVVKSASAPVSGGIATSRVALPASLRQGAFILVPQIRFADGAGWRQIGPTVVRGASDQVELHFPASPGMQGSAGQLKANGRPIPPTLQVTTTRPISIGRDALLRVGLGIDPVGAAAGAAPAEFLLTARAESGERELIRTVVDPRDRGSTSWNDRRVDLSPFAGQSVRFTFQTRVLPRPGSTSEEAFSVPLWGAPEILEPSRSAADHPNLLLISIDTLRADHVGAYGSSLPTTPRLEKLAAQGTLFEEVLAAYPSTAGSHLSMLTGVYPSVHGVTQVVDRLPRQIKTIAELLSAQGYETGAFTEDGMLYAPSGFQRGFVTYHESKGTDLWDTKGQVRATFAGGLNWVASHPHERFFLFLHTYQTHWPYDPPAAFNLFTTYRRGSEEIPISRDTEPAIRDRHLYAGEVRYVDAELGKLLDGLAALHELERTLVVVTSDHGEEFGEHGRTGHGWTLFDEVLHVPLILRAPGLLVPGLRVPDQVSLVDLVPTLLDLLDLPVPRDIQGESLVPLLRQHSVRTAESTSSERVAWAELLLPGKSLKLHLIAERDLSHKWIFKEGSPEETTAYDLQSDPGEHRPIDDPELVARGRELFEPHQRLIATAAANSRTLSEASDGIDATEVDPQTIGKLRALGYLR